MTNQVPPPWWNPRMEAFNAAYFDRADERWLEIHNYDGRSVATTEALYAFEAAMNGSRAWWSWWTQNAKVPRLAVAFLFAIDGEQPWYSEHTRKGRSEHSVALRVSRERFAIQDADRHGPTIAGEVFLEALARLRTKVNLPAHPPLPPLPLLAWDAPENGWPYLSHTASD